MPGGGGNLGGARFDGTPVLIGLVKFKSKSLAAKHNGVVNVNLVSFLHGNRYHRLFKKCPDNRLASCLWLHCLERSKDEQRE